jgi:hypothetical protein
MIAQDRRDPERLFCQIAAGARPAEVVLESPTSLEEIAGIIRCGGALPGRGRPRRLAGRLLDPEALP